MYYVIQKNVFQDPRYNLIFEVLEDLNLDYEQVEFKVKSNEFSLQTDRKDIFVYGSVKLAKVTAAFDWSPGSFYGNNHEFAKYSKGYGNNIINYDSSLLSISDEIDWPINNVLFIKPAIDAKVFTGKVFHKTEWQDFIYNSLNDKNNNRLTVKTLIQVSEPIPLIKEARVWIIGKEVVTSSYYKFHGNVPFENKVAQKGIDFAKKMAHLYNVADAYVMDIALTDLGWKIVEINCINSAGFYNGNIKKIVLALEAYF